MSLVLSALRPLHKTELDAAVRLYVSQCTDDDTPEWKIGEVSENRQSDVLSFTRKLLVENEGGHIELISPAMMNLLRAVWVRGIDSSHRTIATLCLLQNQANGLIEGSDVAMANKRLVDHVDSTFSSYAANYWEHHHREASKVSLKVGSI